MRNSTKPDPTTVAVFSRFFDGTPVSTDVIDTGIRESDFRHVVIATTQGGEKYVLKITSNDFTFPEKIRMWQRTAEEYLSLGYYCPRIFADKNGDFPTVEYCGHSCVVYAEEYSKYKLLFDRGSGDTGDTSAYAKDIWTMTAKIAQKHLDYTDYPSAYCLFETFCPSDETDEVLENALEWKKCADALPQEFSAQVQRIWRIWSDNREALKAIYHKLPTSVFQADLNPTNLLVDDNGVFKGVCDFNLCGREVFLNYLMRENYDDFEKELEMIRNALKIASEHYVFSDAERRAALQLYRCLKPLWFTRVDELKEAGNDAEKIRKCLDRVEYYLTANIDFEKWMG